MTKVNKRLAIFFDGTWNYGEQNTNVWRTKSLVAPISTKGVRQLCYYDIGVNGFFGGGFGKGLSKNVAEAYRWLMEHYEEGDEVYLFGFSRGAFTARSLAGFIAKYGLLRLGAPLAIDQLYERYKRAEDRTIRKLHELNDQDELKDETLEEKWMLTHAIPINIKMVGVWDTVGSLGVPYFSFVGISRETLMFHHTGLRVPIEHGFHAMAIDEHRADFPATIWTVKKTTQAEPRSLESVEQRWFVGAHANVGGGYHSDPLTQRPLQWLTQKAEKLGLEMRRSVEFDELYHRGEIADSYWDFLRGWYKVAKFLIRHYRPIGKDERNVDGVESYSVNETIDWTVFERWRQDKTYRPKNLDEWAKRRAVDLAGTKTSVRADRPKERVPD